VVQVDRWTKRPALPGALIDAAKNTAVGGTPYLSWFRDRRSSLYDEWVAAETYLGWAQTALAQGDASGCDTALTYAKRAVCRRIDGFLAYNHLGRFDRKSYPEKCDILRAVGIGIPGVVHDLAIDPRNESEHRYQAIEEKTARHAAEVAGLFIEATREEARRGAVVALNWNLDFRNSEEGGRPVSTVVGYGECPMLLIDIFQGPAAVKFVRRADGEVEYAVLEEFSKDEAVELAKFLRQHYQADGSYRSWDSDSYLRYLQAAGI
jgi:hypothetical protein